MFELRRFSLQVVAVASLAFCTPLMAQLTLSTIRGTVTDPAGALVVKAEIRVTSLETNFNRTTLTNENGEFEIPDVRRGTYRLTATSPGFKNFVADNIILESSQIRRINIALELGPVGAEVTVKADAAVISTDTSKIQGAFTKEKYDTTPWVGTFLYPTLPLSTLPNVQSRGSKWDVSFAGQSGNQIQTGMDGHTNDGTGNQIINMPDVQELSVVTVNN
ncbi:MAG TPA: carboxypeptidase-like regulatory domain-containing protein, partial [Clostridia bacterium]|nr:carboxypeptidase-like regulatory domain-containing protein [Clostridia bacterium]